MSDALIAFLRARLDDGAQVALAASPGPWRSNAEHDEVVAVDGITVADGFALSGNQLRATVDHIVRWDPARVLALIGALRRAVDEFSSEAREVEIIMSLAEALYADHPDYRAEWRPAAD